MMFPALLRTNHNRCLNRTRTATLSRSCRQSQQGKPTVAPIKACRLMFGLPWHGEFHT